MTRGPDLIWLQRWLIQWLNDHTNQSGSCSLFALLSSVLVYPHGSSPQGPKMAYPNPNCRKEMLTTISSRRGTNFSHVSF